MVCWIAAGGPARAQTPATAPASAPAASRSTANGPVARVNGLSIYRSDVDRTVAALAGGRQIDASALAAIQAAALEQLIEQRLVLSHLQSQKALASAQEVNALFTQLRQNLENQGVSLVEFLNSKGHTESSLRNELLWEISRNKWVERQITDERMEQYFNAHREDFDGTERRAAHILFRPEGTVDEDALKGLAETAESVRQMLANRELSFEDAVKKYSAGPSRLRGGDLGFIPRQGPMHPNFTNALFALEKHQLSPPVATPFGVHLIVVTEIRPGQRNWRDVRGPLTNALAGEILQELVQAQRSSATIEYAADFPHVDPQTRQLVVPSPG